MTSTLTAPPIPPPPVPPLSKPANGKSKIVATYDYCDGSGAIVYQVVRWEPGFDGESKAFRPRVPDKNGGWKAGLNGAQTILYNLPALVSRPDETVYVVEGEKDVDRLRQLGMLATSNPFGAGKWLPEYSEQLRGRRIVIIPDNDEPGEKHLAVVQDSLKGFAKSIAVLRLPNLPHKGDVSDWLDANGDDKNGLMKLAIVAESLAEWQSNRSPNDAYDASEDDLPAQAGGNASSEHIAPEPPAYQPFPLATLAQPIRDYVDAAGRALGVDSAFVALPLLTTLAGAIGNSRRIRLKKSWSEPAIIWTAIVGESGTQKSPAIDAAKRFPKRRQQSSHKRFQEAMAGYEIELARYERDYAAWKRSKGTGEPPEKPAAPVGDRCLVDDTTVEALAPILLDNWRGVAIVKDELAGWLGGFDKYSAKGKQGADAAKWLEMHGARTVVIDRKTGVPRTIVVPMASVSVAGGIQPGTLRRAIGQEYRDNGLLARLLLAWPPRCAKRWSEADVDPSLVKAVGAAYDRLFELAPEIDDNGEPAPKLVTLAQEAKELFVTFANSHGQEQAGLDGDLAAAWSKLEGYAARLALVHHLARWAVNEAVDDGVLDAVSMAAGIELVKWFAAEARRVYGTLDESDKDRETAELLSVVQRRGGVLTARDLRDSGRKFRTPGKAESALDGLVKNGLGSWHTVKTNGRDARIFKAW